VDHVRQLLATRRGRFILAFLAVQLLLPLHYYVLRHDPHDERFAWRMFSPMRMTRCQAQFTVGTKPIVLGATFHEAWIEMVERGRFVVIEAMAERLCEQNPGSAVELSLDCSYIDRPPRHIGQADMCKTPEL
jgi:hypothetical protein